jgi:orotate phosphoribosyltransferase
LLTNDDVRKIFIDSGALMQGHFLLSSGKHSGEYWEKFWVLQYPDRVQNLCTEIARRFAEDRIELVLGPTTGGILLAFEVARQFGVKALYAESENGKRALRRGLTLDAQTRTLIVDDVMTTGLAVKECIDLANEHGAEIVGTAVLVDRSGGAVDLGYRSENLLTVEAVTYESDVCPLCAQGLPLKKPGSRAQPFSSPLVGEVR